jgi:hypothetical protein
LEEGIGEVTNPVRGCENPINLLKKGITLHVAPCKIPSFKRDLNQAQIADDFIEDHNVIHISSVSISV